MRKNLLAIVGAASLAVLSGCATSSSRHSTMPRGLTTETDYQRHPIKLATPFNVKGGELRRVTNNDYRYALESQVVHEEEYDVQPNRYQGQNEEAIILIKSNESREVPDEKSKTLIVEADTIYIPQIVNAPDGKPARRIPLSNDGPYGVSVKFTKYDLKNVQTGIIRKTQEDAQFEIKTMTLGFDGEGRPIEWYIPKVERNSAADADALPFYMIRKETAFPPILNRKTEQVELATLEGIYRPRAVKISDYDLRAEEMAEAARIKREEKEKKLDEERLKRVLQGNNPGQAEGIK